jgi:hypothetical protein
MQKRTHIVVGLLLLLLLSRSSLLSSAASSSSATSSSSAAGTTAGNGGKLLGTLGDELQTPQLATKLQCHRLYALCAVAYPLMPYLVDVLAFELADEGVETVVVSLDTDGAEDLLDVLGRGRRVAADGEEQVSCEMLHFE